MFWSRRLIARELVRALSDLDPGSVTTWSSPISEVHVVVVRYEHVRGVLRTVAQAGGFQHSTRVDGVWQQHDDRVIVRIAVPSDAVAFAAAQEGDLLRQAARRAGHARVGDWADALALPERDEMLNLMTARTQAAVTHGPFGQVLAVDGNAEPHSTLAVLLKDLIAPPDSTTSPSMLAATMARALITHASLIDVADALTRTERNPE